MRQILVTFLLLWGIAFSQCDPESLIDLFPATPGATALPTGAIAPKFDACSLDGLPVDFGEVMQDPSPILVVGFSGSWQNAIQFMPFFASVDSTYGIRSFLIYTMEAFPDTSCADSICVYAPQTTCPDASTYCQASTIHMKIDNAMIAATGYRVRILADNGANEFWNKYGNLPFPGYLIANGKICKSWQEFNPSNFGAWVNSCRITATTDPLKGPFNGFAFSLDGKRKPMTFEQWKRSDWPWYFDGNRKYKRE